MRRRSHMRPDGRKRPKKPRRSGQRPSPDAIPPGVQFATHSTIGTGGRVPKAAQPQPTEPMFVQLLSVMEEEGAESKEELDEIVGRYMVPGQRPSFPEPTEPWLRAQKIAYEGWEQDGERAQKKAARRALDISPDAVDGYLLQAHHAASWEEALSLCTKAVDAAERLLGPDFLTEYEGGFWEMASTRPYMRARFALAYCLWRQDERSEAIAHFQDLIELNEEDNQGVRYVLTAILLEKGENHEAARLMKTYSPGILCHWPYNQALIELRRDNRSGARRRLKEAKERNALVPDFLLGERDLRSLESLDFIKPGERSEAIEYWQLYHDAWEMSEGALAWLEGQV